MVINHLRVREPRLQRLRGETFDHFERRGKFIIARMRSGAQLLIHLRMSGRILIRDKDYRKGKHDHLRLTFAGTDKVLIFRDLRKFGRWEWASSRSDSPLKKLGIEATETTGRILFNLLQESRRPVKALLLDQTQIAGIGNIYADEALYRSRIHPLQLSHTIDLRKASLLASAIRQILRSAIDKMGTTFDTYSGVNGSPGRFARYLKVYGREGLDCRRCGTAIVKIRAAGRGTHLCTRCQPLPRNHQRKVA